MLWILGLLTLLIVASAGLTLVKTGRDLEAGAHSTRTRKVAALVDDRLLRARTAVEVLIQPDVDVDDVLPRSSAAHRGRTYAVMGIGLLGLGAAAALGWLLLGG